MTKSEFSRCLAVAQNMDVQLIGTHEDVDIMGYGLEDFEPVTTTLMGAAEAIRWQCLQFNGAFDQEQVKQVSKDFVVRNKIRIHGVGSDEWENNCKTLDMINDMIETI